MLLALYICSIWRSRTMQTRNEVEAAVYRICTLWEYGFKTFLRHNLAKELAWLDSFFNIVLLTLLIAFFSLQKCICAKTKNWSISYNVTRYACDMSLIDIVETYLLSCVCMCAFVRAHSDSREKRYKIIASFFVRIWLQDLIIR